MRVTLVIQKVAGLRGGAERVVIELGSALVAMGHEVTLVTYEPGTAPSGYDLGEVRHVDLLPRPLRWMHGRRAPGERLDRTERVASTRGNGRLLANAKWHATHGLFGRRLARWLAVHPQDAVVGFLPPSISAVAVAKRLLGVKAPRTIASTHNVPEEDFGDSPRWDQNPVARRTNLWALGAVDAVTVLQPEFIDSLPTEAQEHAVVMPNAVSRLSAAGRVARERRIVGVGRLTDVKQYDTLVRAFAALDDVADGWNVAIYGEGPEREPLQALIESLGLAERVTLEGTTTEIAEVYESAKILAHPARFEGFGLSVAEAILHGLSVVAWSDCPGVNRLIEADVTGLLLPPASDPVASFAAGLRRLIVEPLDESARQAGADRLTARLAPTAVYSQWEQLLTET